MPRLQNPATGDVNVVDDSLVAYYQGQGWVDYVEQVDPALLAAATAALEAKAAGAAEEDAGLKSGAKTAATRQRAETPNTPTTEE